MPLKVEGSTSKAQNVNAAMSHVRGEFVGMFDADHHPDPAAFTRAWRWLSNGYDVVQGHCVIRNGDASLVAQTVAVEFEADLRRQPPRPRRAARLRAVRRVQRLLAHQTCWPETRMHGSMLTEDIDSTLRVLAAGAKIASDPALISRELAPDHRRRAVEAAHPVGAGLVPGVPQAPVADLALAEPDPAPEGRLAFLLGWREVYPWLSLQILPVLGYTAYRDGGVTQLRWLAPALLLSTLFTLAVGPAQTLFAKRLAVPEVRRAQPVVLELPAGVLDRLHGVEEHHRPRRPGQGAPGGAPVERHPPHHRDPAHEVSA